MGASRTLRDAAGDRGLASVGAIIASGDPDDLRRVARSEAPISLVFDALTKPEHVCVWFSADGVPLHICEIDLRVGGTYHFA